MQVLRYDQPRVARIVESPAPVARGKASLAKMLVTNVSAGTEMGFYRGTAPQLNARIDSNQLFSKSPGAITYPMQSDGPGVWWMGYSAVGQIVEVGSEETRLRIGDLVWTQQGHKSMMSSDWFVKLPDDVNVEHASLLALIQIAFNGMLDARVKLLDEVVIFGMGTLGQLLAQMCSLSGARVTAIDMMASRREMACKLGAASALDPAVTDPGLAVQEATKGKGADVVFEVTGNVNALPHAIRCAGTDGTVTVLSFYQGTANTLDLGQEFHHKRTTLRSSQIGRINPAFSGLYDGPRRRDQSLVLLKKLQLEPLISHRVAFAELPQALQIIDKDPAACQAVVVRYK